MIIIVPLVAIGLLAFLFYASCNIRSGIYMRVFSRKRTTEKVIALTFDDGPDGVITPQVLSVLKEYNVPACFFCIGNKIHNHKENKEILRQILAEGHLVGNHSYSHNSTLPFYGRVWMKEDFENCRCAIGQATSYYPRMFRPPFGVTNPTIAKAVRDLKYIPIGWDIRTFDTMQGSTPEKVVNRIRRKIRPGSVILLHDRMPQSAETLKQVLNFLREEEYSVVRIDKLMD